MQAGQLETDSTDVAVEGSSDVTAVVQLIERKSESVRGPYNSLSAGEVQQGAEQVVAFIDACRRAKLGEQSDFAALQECLARMVLSRSPFADFRSTNLDGEELVAEVSRALDDMEQETKRATRGIELLLNHVVPPSQWPSSTKPIGSAQEAASQVQSFVSNALKPFAGEVQAVGHPEHFIARQGWRVPVTLKSEDGQEYQGEVTIYDNGEIMQRTRGMLRQTFGIAEQNEE